MKKILLFDVESSGLYNPKLTAWDKNQAWIVQFAGLVINPKTLNIRQKLSFIMKPPHKDAIITEGAQSIHGISLEEAKKIGVDDTQIRILLKSLFKDEFILVAHNLKFDHNFLHRFCYTKEEHLRLAKAFKNGICTMNSTKNFCKLPATTKMIKAGFTGYKQPKLVELHEKLFKKDFKGQHDALSDVMATFKCFKELLKLKIIKL